MKIDNIGAFTVKKKIIALCLLSAFMLSLSGCADRADGTVSETTTGTRQTAVYAETSETVKETEQTAAASDTSETAPEETQTSREIPIVGDSEYLFARKYIDEVYNCYLPAQIVGQEAYEKWVNNVLLAMPSEEQTELPTVYMIIHDLDISKEEFIAENEKLVDYPDMYFSEEIISALYLDDIGEMKKQLADPLTLYYDGEVYTFDELFDTDEDIAAKIPTEILSGYFDFIEQVCEKSDIIKYYRDKIDFVREKYGA